MWEQYHINISKRVCVTFVIIHFINYIFRAIYTYLYYHMFRQPFFVEH